MVPIHVAGGAIGILSGLIALYSLKGKPLHRGSGAVFVYAMLVMSLSGALMSIARGREPGNVIMGCLTAYLVVSGLFAARGRRIKSHIWRMCAALFVATGSFFLGPVRRIPEPLRAPAFRLIPILVLATMAYWLWRYRRKRFPRGAIAVAAVEAH